MIFQPETRKDKTPKFNKKKNWNNYLKKCNLLFVWVNLKY